MPMHLSLTLALALTFLALILTISLTFLLLFLLFRKPATKKDHTKELELEQSSNPKEEEEKVRRYKWTEIESLTGNFTAPVVGQGGFSTVYLATLHGFSEPVALKVHRCSGGERLLRAFRHELDLLCKIQHPNIVSIYGFSDDHEEEGALVLEYLPNGNLHQKLHGSQGGESLTWKNRMKILYELAGAIEYLHVSMDPPIVHSDITSSNVLLDCQLSARLCDFGSARAGFSASVSRSGGATTVVASPGYVDPYYLRTGIVSKNSDVYSFGVLIFEVITGLPAVGLDGRNLTSNILPCGERGLGDLVDCRLNGAYVIDEVVEMMELAVRCVGPQPSLRPSIVEIREIIRERVRSSTSAVDGKVESKGLN
ncbi:hypothetical protein LUZ60_007261 [Juncus effusus]|nr:hypothetical protein LUZ60_007261 [Juncus effusus]